MEELNHATFPIPRIDPKGWGCERLLFHNADYTAKFLDFKAGSSGSTHFHANKHESWHILSGEIEFTWIDTATSKRHVRILTAENQVDIPRLCPHRVRAIKDTRIMEVSTPHRDEDSYRVEPGDSQRETTQ